jgi:ethanolamine utilization protein EutN
MRLGKVIGSVVATRKDERLVGHKLLFVQFLFPTPGGGLGSGSSGSDFVIAVDMADAGVSDVVLLVSGSSARAAAGDINSPVDASIIGIVERVDVSPREAFFG